MTGIHSLIFKDPIASCTLHNCSLQSSKSEVDAGNGNILSMYKENGDDDEHESGDQGDQDR